VATYADLKSDEANPNRQNPEFSSGLENPYNGRMNKFRVLSHKEEFFKMVTKAPVREIGEIWQTLPHKREVYTITNLELLKEVMIFQTKLHFDFDPNFPIFVKINYKNLIFKISPTEFKTYHNQMSCEYPSEAKAIEDRSLERTKLPKKSNLNITLRSAGRNFKVSLDDISEGGIGVRTSIVNMEQFQPSTLFKIIKVCGQPLNEEATLSVRHTSTKGMKDFIGVGLAADAAFSNEFYEIIRLVISRQRHESSESLLFAG
jgi:hypothetical protein